MTEPYSVESTAHLLERIRAGDEAARDRLLSRYLPVLQRWARGRLPARGRGMTDTDDLVQVTFMRVLGRLDALRPEREGAFLAYLRQTLLNALRDELRRSSSKTLRDELHDNLADDRPSLLEQAIGQQAVSAYEKALAKLGASQQEAVILRVEFQLSYGEIAEAIGSPSANAARMSVSRALAQLSRELAPFAGHGAS